MQMDSWLSFQLFGQKTHQGLVIQDPTDGPVGSRCRIEIARLEENVETKGLIPQIEAIKRNERRRQIEPESKTLKKSSTRVGDRISPTPGDKLLSQLRVIQRNSVAALTESQGGKGPAGPGTADVDGCG